MTPTMRGMTRFVPTLTDYDIHYCADELREMARFFYESIFMIRIA